MLGEDGGKSDEFGVTGAIQGPVCFVHTLADDLAIFDEDTAHGCFVADECEFGHIDGLAHEALMIHSFLRVHGGVGVTSGLDLAADVNISEVKRKLGNGQRENHGVSLADWSRVKVRCSVGNWKEHAWDGSLFATTALYMSRL